MKSVNKVILVGNLGQDPEMRYLPGNIAKAKFSLATNQRFKNKAGEWVEQTEWHRIVVWRKQAEIAAKFLRKGSKIYLEGQLKTRSWVGKDDRQKSVTEIIVDEMILLDRKEE